jgi:hypothetical protein
MTHGFQLLLIVLIVLAILLLPRIFSSTESDPSSRAYEDLLARNRSFTRQRFGGFPSNDGKLPTAPISMDLGRVTVIRFNFLHFDAVPGPPDPESFADELMLELYDSVSDFRWTTTYVVATPSGIRKLMDDERWSFFYATEIFVVRRYDLQTIREAVYGRIKEVHDQVALDAEAPPDRT